MAYEHFHIMVGDTPWCDWLGTQAGREIEQEVGDIRTIKGQGKVLVPYHVMCGHTDRAKADEGVAKLQTHFKDGIVKVVIGRCPRSMDKFGERDD